MVVSSHNVVQLFPTWLFQGQHVSLTEFVVFQNHVQVWQGGKLFYYLVRYMGASTHNCTHFFQNGYYKVRFLVWSKFLKHKYMYLEEIIEKKLVAKRYDLSLSQLERMNWTIVYP